MIFLSGLVFNSFALSGQDIFVTFTGTGESAIVDVTALNQRTNQTVTFPGNATLLLRRSSGIQDISQATDGISVYPNPFSGTSRVVVEINEPQTAVLKVQTLTGQVVTQTGDYLRAGANEFELSLADKGYYLIGIETSRGQHNCRLINLSPSGQVNRIRYAGWTGKMNNQPGSAGMKNSLSRYSLEYAQGDIIHYTCYSGDMTTIVTDTPESSKNYEVEFAGCTDADGKHYCIVKIGDQTWMEENLAYLPAVSPSSESSDTDPRYYVYGCESTNVGEAISNPNYAAYGVLYNWEAAKLACPAGWHLPNDDEWKTLEKYLGMSTADADASGLRESGDIGRKLKSISGWFDNGNGDNSSGFNAVPGGVAYSGGFGNLGDYAVFWSSTEEAASDAWSRDLVYNDDGVYRSSNGRGTGFPVRCLKNSGKPVANLTIKPTVGTTATTFRFDASGSTDAETPPEKLAYRWDWNGDSIWDTPYDTIEKITHQYPEPGSYRVVLEVRDADGGTGREHHFVIVADGILADPRDGHEYLYKTIGTQTWMIENLAYLPSVSPPNTGSYHVNGYTGTSVSEAKSTPNYIAYGVLYRQEAANPACPAGWHLPSDEEWKILEKYLGMSAADADAGRLRETGNVGRKLKSATGWFYNGNGDNSSGFNAVPGGRFYDNGGFSNPGDYGYFWTATSRGNTTAWCRIIYYSSDGIYRDQDYRRNGYSVRCVRN
jgi:uncharacterized protein (TIGR02145 family)